MTALSRRTLVKGTAWTVPAIVVAAGAPALASSRPEPTSPTGNSFLAIAAANVNNPTIKDPIYDYTGTTDSVGLPTVLWKDSSSTPTVNWNDSGCQSAQTFSRGVGVFTPHGTKGIAPGAPGAGFSDSAVSGSGIWIGSPVDQWGNPMSGRTVLSAGTTIVVTVTALMSEEKWAWRWNGEETLRRSNGVESYLMGPRIPGRYTGDNTSRATAIASSLRSPGNAPMSWGRIGTTKVARSVGHSNGWRVAEIGAPMTRTMTWDRERPVTATEGGSLTLVGRAVFVLDQELAVAGVAGRQRFNQVLVNTNTVWEATLNEQISEVTWALDVTSGTLTSNGVARNAAEVFPHREITIRHASNPANVGVCRA